MEPPGSGRFPGRGDGNKIPGIFHKTLETRMLCYLSVLLLSMATELASLTRVWFLCSPGLPTFLEVLSGGMEAAASRVIGGLKERSPRHRAPGTVSSWRDKWSLGITAAAEQLLQRIRQGRGGGRGSFSSRVCYYLLPKYHVCSQPCASSRKSFSTLF